MLKKVGVVLLLVVFAFSVSGCASARKQRELEMQGLRNQISVLEAQVQAKDEEIAGLKDSLDKMSADKEQAAPKKRIIGEVKSRPKAKEIQIALRNAGYDPGAIDGKMGRKTREAVRAFQRNNGLAVDGKVGRQTWALLKEYLYKKVK
jgi:peptidoglycan hydrolase-like protein with peptidoglycan-binding domain